MKRRDFLKSVFGVAAGLAVAPSVVKSGVTTYVKWEQLPVRKSNAETDFCYGGRLFRVDHHLDGTNIMLTLRHEPWINTNLMTKKEFANREYRNLVCEHMLCALERKLKV